MHQKVAHVCRSHSRDNEVEDGTLPEQNPGLAQTDLLN